ncbi:RNA polymerase sigma factor [Lysobacter sp. GX 14042]|uniref:RNA polymerase sigma factor n=1 Tax=Lysobacter sp. GX 14042 TaxID=2907155 RepID=UPI001F1CFF15|nr:RNA polymerase sigma factor [Lysobacter sp. GX 14042]MCE7032539.1 RNA polymerase sigma factor [Lysobacter sp. GX 14042]
MAGTRDPDTPLSSGRAAWLAEHVLPHEPELRRWLGGRLGLPAQDVDDIVQESYAKLAGLDGVEHVREPRAYLHTVARSLVHQHLRRAQVVAIETMAELDGLGGQDPGASPERFAASRQQLALAQRLVAGLPGRCQEVFRLRRIEGLSQRETSARLKISQSTVEKHMVKALRLLMAGVQTNDEAAPAPPGRASPGRNRSHGRA